MSANLDTAIIPNDKIRECFFRWSKKSHAKELEECLFIPVCRQHDIGGALLWQVTFWEV